MRRGGRNEGLAVRRVLTLRMMPVMGGEVARGLKLGSFGKNAFFFGLGPGRDLRRRGGDLCRCCHKIEFLSQDQELSLV